MYRYNPISGHSGYSFTGQPQQTPAAPNTQYYGVRGQIGTFGSGNFAGTHGRNAYLEAQAAQQTPLSNQWPPSVTQLQQQLQQVQQQLLAHQLVNQQAPGTPGTSTLTGLGGTSGTIGTNTLASQLAAPLASTTTSSTSPAVNTLSHQDQYRKMASDPDLTSIFNAIQFTDAAIKKGFVGDVIMQYINDNFKATRPKVAPTIHYVQPAPTIIRDTCMSGSLCLHHTDNGLGISGVSSDWTTQYISKNVYGNIPPGSNFYYEEAPKKYLNKGTSLAGPLIELFAASSKMGISFPASYRLPEKDPDKILDPELSQSQDLVYRASLKSGPKDNRCYISLNRLLAVFVKAGQGLSSPDIIKLLKDRTWFKASNGSLESASTKLPDSNYQECSLSTNALPEPQISVCPLFYILYPFLLFTSS